MSRQHLTIIAAGDISGTSSNENELKWAALNTSDTCCHGASDSKKKISVCARASVCVIELSRA